MQEAAKNPSIRWSPGNPGLWKIDPVGERPDYVVRYAGSRQTRSFFHDEAAAAYAPLDRPRLYEDLAAVGEKAVRLGSGRETGSKAPGQPRAGDVTAATPDLAFSFAEEWERILVSLRRASFQPGLISPSRGRPETAMSLAELQAMSVADSQVIHREVLDFVRKYGPLELLDDQGAPVAGLLQEAARLYQAIQDDRVVKGDIPPSPEVKRLGPFKGKDVEFHILRRDEAATRGLRGVYFTYRLGELVATCSDLLSAAWLQFAQISSRARWRVCEGCGRLFAQGRTDQSYHNSACRNAASVRRVRGK